MSSVTYALSWSPLATTGFFQLCPTICLYRKQLIILHDKPDLSILPHLEVEVTYDVDDVKGPLCHHKSSFH